MKSKGTAYLLWCCSLLFLCGLHRFYLGKWGTGLLWLFTFGLLGLGTLIDLFTLGSKVDVYNTQQELNTLVKVSTANALNATANTSNSMNNSNK
ncbi:MAG: TM2 domain-containing protein [Bacteroidales bacterium]|nr:TM2 domain-containing protein [Candidatus Scybalousia scybalohippi]MCQ2327422.1 TM2 domain-containing protein [Bacteroidales bacterium]